MLRRRRPAGEPKAAVSPPDKSAPPAQWLPPEGVEMTLRADKAEYELGEPIVLSITYRNSGKETYHFDEPSGGCCSFSATAKTGRIIPRAPRDSRLAGTTAWSRSTSCRRAGGWLSARS